MTDTETDFARCFASSHGVRVLEYLHKITVNRTLGINASDAELRWAAAQCALVRQIDALISRGREDKS